MIVTHVHPPGWADTNEPGLIQPSEVSGMAHQVVIEPGDLPGLVVESAWSGDGAGVVAGSDLLIPSVLTGGNVFAVASIGGKLVAAGQNGKVIVSDDGVEWVVCQSGTTQSLYSLAYGAACYVVVGGGGVILRSVDGVNWVGVASGTTKVLVKVLFENNVFIVVGDGGVILRSVDGVNWVGVGSGVTTKICDVIFEGGGFLAVGYAGVVLSSSDGVSWVKSVVEVGATWANLLRVVAGGGVVIAAGANRLFKRVGGVWSRCSGVEYGNIYVVEYLGGKFIGVGDYGAIFESSDGVEWVISWSGQVGFLAVGEVAGSVVAVGTSGCVAVKNEGGWRRGEFSSSICSQQPHIDRFANFAGRLFFACNGGVFVVDEAAKVVKAL